MTTKHHVCLKNGRFDTDTPAENLAEIFSSINSDEYKNKPLVIHFHGGLVNKEVGIGIATRLTGRYSADKATCYPLFIVWESGLLEVIGHNIPEILNEDLFKRVLKKLLRFIVSKITQEVSGGKKGGKITLLTEKQAEIKITEGIEAPRESELPTNDEISQLNNLLEDDVELKNTLGGILKEKGDESTKGLHFPSVKSRISKEFLDRMKKEMKPEPKGRGLLTMGKVLLEIAKIAIEVVKRFINGTAHGVYVTIVEEILRKLYIDDIGGEVWYQMKKDTLDAFANESSGGNVLLKHIKEGNNPATPRRIILIGHSTGAVYICNLLKHADENKLPAEIKFDIILLAPACTFKLFSDTVKKHEGRINSIINFGMKDEVETSDHMVPVLYPHSLLYFVSGLLERDENQESFVDMPLVGMERFYDPENVHAGLAEVQHVKKVLDNKLVWSTSETGPGRMSSSVKHGDFDNDVPTLDSIVHYILNK